MLVWSLCYARIFPAKIVFTNVSRCSELTFSILLTQVYLLTCTSARQLTSHQDVSLLHGTQALIKIKSYVLSSIHPGENLLHALSIPGGLLQTCPDIQHSSHSRRMSDHLAGGHLHEEKNSSSGLRNGEKD